MIRLQKRHNHSTCCFYFNKFYS